MSVQVKVGCISSFPQLVEHINEGVELNHDLIINVLASNYSALSAGVTSFDSLV